MFVTNKNVILSLAELETQQFPLVQSCLVPKLVSTSDKVCKASAEAEKKIDAHVAFYSKQEDVYRVVKAFAAKGEWMGPEAKKYVQCLDLLCQPSMMKRMMKMGFYMSYTMGKLIHLASR
ncbi:hypothetical protein REPUB_Repub14bG0047600 [Reevesia pubescens]